MGDIELRAARELDSKQIVALIHLVGINPSALDWHRFVVAVNSAGQIVGCGQIKPHGKDIHELASIAVHPDYRGRGIARAVIEWLLTDPSRPLYLMCMSSNGPMYEKFAFHSLTNDEMPRYYRRIKKLFDVADVVLHSDEKLLVMKLE